MYILILGTENLFLMMIFHFSYFKYLVNHIIAMKKERILLIWIFLIFIYMISLVSADIFLTQQPKDIYNVDDEMSLILGSDGVVGWAGMNLICGNYSQMIYFHYLSKSET